MAVVFKCCDNFNISKMLFSCKGKGKGKGEGKNKNKNKNKNNKRDSFCEEEDACVFNLVKSEHTTFKDFIPPTSKNYMYLKILSSGKIISMSGDYYKKLLMKPEEIINKKISSLTTGKTLFVDFITPLFEACVKNSEAYQFNFKCSDNGKTMSCSLYPCPIPGSISSVDVVIRNNKEALNIVDPNDFIINNETKGRKMPVMI